MSRAWLSLVVAGVLEIAWALGLKASNGLSRPWISAATIIGMLASFGFLSVAMKSLPVGTAYAVWTGIGAAGTALLGMFFFGEPRTAWRLGCIALIVAGIVGLKLGQR